MKPLHRRQVRVAAIYLSLGLAALAVSAVFGRISDWPLWALFTLAFVFLELNAVEVNDRMFQSSSIMVVLTAGTIFALRDNSTAAVAMVLMAAAGPLTPADLRQRRWFQPLANMGQLMVAAAAAGWILDVILDETSISDPDVLLWVALAGALASLAYTFINLMMVRGAVKTVYGPRNLLPWSGIHLLFSSQVVMGLLGGLLGAALVIVERDAVVVLILVVYLIAHLSLSSYSQLREAHQAALRGFVKALEARDLYTRGHTERVAYFSQLIGEELRFTGTQLERLRWACLIHDLGKLAIPADLIAKRGRLTPEEMSSMRSTAQKVEEILAEVDFLRPMVSISGVHYLDLENFDPEEWSLDASIVAVADAFDALTSTRSYRMAMPQIEAFAELRRDETGRFYPDVIQALESGLKRTGEVYGGSSVRPDLGSVAEEANIG
ncbi:MAG TPA: HD domain-containing phosphohydrolase [Acidimicrobiia bacterium]|nr:HD domain-containing phosphohydrolase [Acidimicrobiia bacterium]